MSFLSSILPLFRGRIALLQRLNRNAVWPCVFFAAFAALSACGPASSSAERGPLSQQDAIAPISLPPGMGDRPLQPGQSGTEYMPNGLPALAPARGVNADTMFSEKLSSDEARFKRLENAVADMRREFESVKPAIIRLSAVESDMEELVAQLQSLVPQAGASLNPSMPPPPGSITIDDAMPLPDIGPMSESQSAELNETHASSRKKTVSPPKAPVAPPEEMKKPEVGSTAPPHTTPVATEKITPDKPVAEKPVAIAPPPAPTPAQGGEIAFDANGKPVRVASAAAPKADAPKVVETPKPETVTPQAAAPAPAGAQTITGVRVGEHGGQTRIVIDAGAKTPFSYNLDNSERLLMIELPKAAWNTGMSAQLAKSPLLSGWTASDTGNGIILAVSLKTNVKVVSATTLAAPFRILFDLKAAP